MDSHSMTNRALALCLQNNAVTRAFKKLKELRRRRYKYPGAPRITIQVDI